MKKVEINKQQLSEADRERLELLFKVNEPKGRQLAVDLNKGSLTEINEIKQMVGKDFENPEEKYNTYYKGIYRLLRGYLPKGKKHEEGRRVIYDEIGVFLNRGKKKSDNNGIRKSDARMTYQPIMNEILDIVIDWVSQSQDPMNLYNSLWNLNEEHGYGHEDYDDTSRQLVKKEKRTAKKTVL